MNIFRQFLPAHLLVVAVLVVVPPVDAQTQDCVFYEADYPQPTTLLGGAATTTPACGVAYFGNYAYVACGADGLQIFDITDPTSPQTVGSVDTPGFANDVVATSDFVVVSDGLAGLQVIDTTDPQAPFIVSTVNTPGDARGLYLKGG